MSTEGQQGAGAQSATQTDNWSAVESAFGQQNSGSGSSTTDTTQNQGDQQQNQGDQTQGNQQEQTQGQNQGDAAKTGENAQQTGEQGKEGAVVGDQAPPIKLELGAEDINKADLPAEAGTWLKRFQERKLEIPTGFTEEKGADHFVEALTKTTEAKIQEARSIGVEQLLSTLKPETATKFKLMEMGLTEEQIFQPTKMLDGYLSMEDNALARAEYSAQGFPEHVVEAKMEALAADPAKMKAFVDEVRFTLNRQKEGIQQKHETLVQQFEAQTAQVQAAQQQEKATQFTKALDTVSDFLGLSIAKEAKELVAKKYQSGAYKDSLGT